MIKTNLIKVESAARSQAGKLIIPVFSAILIIQLIALSIKFHHVVGLKDQFGKVQQKLVAVKAEIHKYKSSDNFQELAGKVAERNNWLLYRRNSPLNKLAKLQKDCPNNVRFLSFNADLTSGKIILTAPDLNSVSSWLNSHFSNRGNISVTGRENNLLMIQYVWSG